MALSSDRNTPRRDGVQYVFPVATGAKIYAGAIVVLDGGYAKPGSTDTGLVVLGIAEAPVDNTLGQNGDLEVSVRRGVFRFENSSAGDAIARADIGKRCYVVDDQTVAKTSGTNTRSVAGVIADVDSDGVWVDLTTEAAAISALYAEASAGMEDLSGQIEELDGRADDLETAVGIPYTPQTSLSTRVSALDTAVGIPYAGQTDLETRVGALENA